MGNRKKIVSVVIIVSALAGSLMLLKFHGGKNQEYKVKNFHNEAFGEQVFVFSPEDNPDEVQTVLDNIWTQQETNQFGKERYSLLFLPGEYDESIQVKVGYYMQVSGLGALPTDTKLEGLECTARWLGDDSNHNATCNFWRGVENISLDSNTMWAVSQATFMRRMNINGALYLHDEYGWASGGFTADSNITLMVDSGSQQQWLSRNCNWKSWMGENWNMVFCGIGEENAPVGTWPAYAYTTVKETPIIQEKPFLMYDEKEGYGVFVPELRENSSGISWENGNHGTFIPLEKFYIAKPGDSAASINQALAEGSHLLLTPGIYELEEPLRIEQENTIVLGMGLATLTPVNGTECMTVSDKAGIKIAGVLFDAGIKESENLLVVGEYKEEEKDTGEGSPVVLSDLFFRVGGAAPEGARVKNCVEINRDNVIGDNFWVWRADHGDGVGWDINTAANGIVINGDNVTMYALMVEHFQEYQTIWNGENGKTIFYQSEIPYDVPNQNAWKSHEDSVNGYASYKVNDAIKAHEAWGLGIYSYHRDAKVDLNSVMEVPDQDNVKIHNVCSIMITGNPGISHVINNCGEASNEPGERQIIREYANGIIK